MPLQNTRERTYHLVVAYDGTDYFGWQVQPGLQTIQGTLRNAVHKVTGASVLPQGAGRTDTGVHAAGQAVSLDLPIAIPPERLSRALNNHLPSAIRVLSVLDAAPGFHARANVVDKTYEYRILCRTPPGCSGERVALPWQTRYAWDCRWPLDFKAMQAAAGALEGTHDFTSFAAVDPARTRRLAALGEPLSAVRTIFCSSWLQAADDCLVYRVTGTGFLHHMVRNIVGTCVEIGSGRRDREAMHGILAARSRSSAGATAPPQGLHMMQVRYRQNATTLAETLGEQTVV